VAEYHSAPPVDANTILEALALAKSPCIYVDGFSPPELFDQLISATGSVSAGSHYIKLSTGATHSNYAVIKRKLKGAGNTATWEKKRILSLGIYLSTDTGQIIHLVTGVYSNKTSSNNSARHVGFKIIGNTLYATVGNGYYEREAEIATLSTETYYHLLAIFYPGQKAEFYLDGELKATLTDRLPSGTEHADWLFQGSIYTTEDADKVIYITWLKVVQLE